MVSNKLKNIDRNKVDGRIKALIVLSIGNLVYFDKIEQSVDLKMSFLLSFFDVSMVVAKNKKDITKRMS